MAVGMKSTPMGRLEIQFSQMGLGQILTKPRLQWCTESQSQSPKIICELRKGDRKPMWKSRVLSTEAIQSLKLAKSSSKVKDVINGRLSRLLKADLLDTLTELQRQNELELALEVFKFVQNDVWYEPALTFYHGMIMILGKNKLVEMAEKVFHELKNDGLEPDTRAFNEMMGAYLQVGMIESAIDTYGLMKSSGCTPDKLTFKILIKNLEQFGEEFASMVKKDCDEYLDSPEKFLKEVELKSVKNKVP